MRILFYSALTLADFLYNHDMGNKIRAYPGLEKILEADKHQAIFFNNINSGLKYHFNGPRSDEVVDMLGNLFETGSKILITFIH